MTVKTSVNKHKSDIISDYKLSKVYVSNHIVEVITVKKQSNSIQQYKKIGKNGCVNLITGEYIEYSNDKSTRSIQNHFTKASHLLRRIINYNFVGDSSEKFITLTYSELMTDYTKANDDFIKFWSKFKYRYPNCEYIKVTEPQQSGSWHLHVLVKDMKNKNLFVKHEELSQLWGNGLVWIESLPFADNFGAYFSVRFSTLEPSDNESKSMKKGSRIKFYPRNFKFYTCSRGIKKPSAVTMTHGEAKKLVNYRSPCYSYTNSIVNADNVEINSITYEQFNLKRIRKFNEMEENL